MKISSIVIIVIIHCKCIKGGSVAEWFACWTQAPKSMGSKRSRDAVE